MNELKRMKELAISFIDKEKYKKINKIKDKEEKLHIFQNTLTSELKIKQLDLDLEIKQISERQVRNILSIKSNIIHSKILLLKTDFNEKDFKKIISLLDKLKTEVSHV